MPLLLFDDGVGAGSGVPKGAIHVDEDPKNYRFQAKFEASSSTNRNAVLSAEGRQRITWGVAYNPGVTGIETYFFTKLNSDTTSTYEITVRTPWGTFFIDSGTIWLAKATVRIEIDALALSVADNCDWALTFTELRIYLDNILKQTVGAQSASGQNFDLREDVVWHRALTMPGETIEVCVGSAIVPAANCGFTYDTQPTHDDRVDASVEGGWQWWDGGSWVSDNVTIVLPDEPPSECECPGKHPDCTEMGTLESYALRVSARYMHVLTKADQGEQTCTCPTMGHITVHYWNRTTNFEHSWATLAGIPETSQISEHRYRASVDCGLDSDVIEYFELEPITHCKAETYVDRHVRLEFCAWIVSSSPCLEGEVCTPALPSAGKTQLCCTIVRRLTDWPTLPVCSALAGCISADVSDSLRHALAYINAGTVWLGFAVNALPLLYTAIDTKIEAECVCIRWVRDSKEQTLIILTEELAVIKYRTTIDEGASISVPTTIASGTKPAMVIGRNGLRYYYWIDAAKIKGQIRDSTNSIVVGTFEVAAAVDVEDKGLAADEFFREGGGHSIELHYVTAGSITTITSPDGQVFS